MACRANQLGSIGSTPRETLDEGKVIAAALAVPLLTDPDLASENAQFAAVEVDPFAAVQGPARAH